MHSLSGSRKAGGLLAVVRAEWLGVRRRLELRCLLLCVRSGWACGGDWGARRQRRLGCVRSCCSSSAQRKNLGAQRRNGSPVMKRKRDQAGQLKGRKRLWASGFGRDGDGEEGEEVAERMRQPWIETKTFTITITI